MKDNNYRDEEIDLVKNFSKFTSYFDKYFESRKNMYSDKAQGTAIANRAINENFVRFINNIVKIQDLEKCGYNLMSKNDEYFDASNYNNYLSQKGIERYNKYIGNINSELNEAYQNKSISKKIKLLVLHKQILSDAEPLFRIEKFENDGEISKGIIDFFDPWLNTNVDKSTPEDKKPLNETINFLDNISDFDKSEIKINTKNISVLSKCLPDRIGRTEIIEILNLEEKKKSEDLLLSDIVEKINLAYEDKLIDFESVINRAKNLLTDYKNSIFDLYQSIRNTLDCNKTSEDKSILGNDDIIAGIKNLFDEVKRAESFRDLFGDRNDIDSSDFQQKYNDCNIGYKEFDKLYNLVRNYLTQKPYNTEKFKLTFNYPTLCNGWDFNKEDDNKSIILFKNSKYYLGILNGFVDSEYYSSNEVSDDTHYYKKLKFKTAGGASKQIPRIAFSEKWSNKSSNEQMQIIKKKKPSERTDRERIELIKFYQNFLKEYDWNNWFNFEFKNPSEYVSMEEFNEDVDSQAYLMDYQYISDKYIYEAVENGSLYLFEIYNKDFSEYSTGKKNLHTYYWELLFSSNNKENGYTFELNGGAELFYRPKSLEKKITHQKNEKIINKTYLKNGNMVSIPDDIYCELVEFLKENSEDETRKCAKKKLNLVDEEIEIRHTPHDIIKDKRYTQDQFNFHVPITINRTTPDTKKVSKTINNDICKLIKESKIKHIIGIDRGERNLIYASVIDMNGKLIEQKNFNIVNGADYHTKLDNKEKLRKSERKNWKSITQIKDLKSGYLSQVVREISDLIIKYDAILVMENLNYGFKSSVRAKFEKIFIINLKKLL